VENIQKLKLFPRNRRKGAFHRRIKTDLLHDIFTAGQVV